MQNFAGLKAAVRAVEATKDPRAVQAIFDMAKKIANPKFTDYVRAVTSSKNPKAVKAIFGVAKQLLSSGALHMLGPVVLPKEALHKFDMLKEKGTTRKG